MINSTALSTALSAALPVENDDNREFYTSGRDHVIRDVVCTPDYLVRITPARVDLPKGAPVDFTIHVKALRDFDSASPLTLRLAPTLGRGTVQFADPKTGDGRIVITMKTTDPVARIIVKTSYPADWWAGFTTIRVDIQDKTSVRYIEANVVVADRVPSAWHRMP
jgi:hypothetical protein